MPWLPMYCQAAAVKPGTMVRPLPRSSSTCASLDQAGTRLPLAITTSGPSARVLNTPIGLPDCITRVSPASSRLSAATARSYDGQSRAACATDM
jgi:hypothetical protein